MESHFHSLLRRQITRHFGSLDQVPDEWHPFLAAIDLAYRQSDSDRQMLERSLDLSSEELGQANARMTSALERLRQAHGELEARVEARTRELTIANETLRTADAQLRQAQKMEAVGRLAGGVAHDFNNLLTIIFGNAELLKDSALAPDLAAIVDEILAASDSAAALTRQLLAFSRRQVLTPKVLGLNELARDTLQLVKRLLGEDIELVARLDPHVESVRADAGQLQQVLINLGINARDAMPHGGRLSVSTSLRTVAAAGAEPGLASGQYAVISVRDSGVGMDPDVKNRIFEPFFTTKALGRGTGLGLATVYGIVKQSGGYIEVESEPGQGSTFHVLLPHLTRHTSTSTTGHAQASGGHGCILVVENEQSVRRIVCSQLRRAGYTIIEAENGPTALETAAGLDRKIDLLLTDIVMPQMDGRALAARLTGLRPDTRVVYMTGYTSGVDVADDVGGHRRALLHKPFTREGLLATVRSALEEGAGA
ncbi:MAG: response regulator [Acidimicrobiia bacterium]|nr:response regulator [Acidimicrobiia bacterium]